MAGKTYTLKLKLNVDGTQELAVVNKQIKSANKEAQGFNQTASESDRMFKGVAQNSKNATSGFAKQAQGMGGLVHIYATVAANIWAMTAAFQVLKDAADLSIMAQAAEDLSRSTGISFGAVAKNMQEITGGALGFTEAMRQANLGLSGGATITQIGEITKIANKAANALGLSVPNAVSRMIQAVTKGEPELVDELGIILRVTKATEEYAASVNKTAQELSTFERQQAIINQLIDQGNEKFKDVTQRTNPFEKVIAGSVDLARTLLTRLTDAIAPIIDVIAESTALLAIGFGVVGKSILNLILPTLLATREEMNKLAKIEGQRVLEKEQQINRAKERGIRLTEKHAKAIKASQSFAGQLTSGKAFSEFSKGGLLDSLDTRKTPVKAVIKLKTQVEDMVKEGASNADIAKAIKDSKVLPRLQAAILAETKGGASVFRKGTTDTVKAAISEELREQKEFARAEKKAASSTRQLATNAINQELLARQKLTGAITASFQASRLEISQNTELAKTHTILYAALIRLNTAYAAARVGQTLYTRSLSIFQQIAKGTILTFTSLGHAIAGAFNKFFGPITTIIIMFQSLKSALGFFGLLNSELDKQSGKLSDLSKELESSRRKYGDIAEVLAETPATLEEVTSKWTKAANVADQYSVALTKIIENSKELQNISLLDRIFSPGSNFAVGNAAEGIISTLREFQKFTSKPVEIEVAVDGKTLKTAKETLENAVSTAQQGRIGKQAGIREKTSEELENIIKLKNQVKLLEKGFLTLSGSIDQDLLEALLILPGGYKIIKAGLEELQKVNLQTMRELAEGPKALSEAVSNIDTKLTDLRNKSSSRRILSVDTFIGFRDEVFAVTEALDKMNTHVDQAGQLSKDAIVSLAAMPNAFDSAFTRLNIEKLFGMDKESFLKLKKEDLKSLVAGITEEDAISFIAGKKAGLDERVKSLDILIDSIRNYKHNLTILTEEEKRLNIARKHGFLANIPKLYNNATEQLRLHVELLEAQRDVQIQLISVVDDQDKNVQKAGLEALKAQLVTARSLLEARKEIVGSLEEEIAIIKRGTDELKAANELTKADIAFKKLGLQVAGKVNLATSLQLKILDEQRSLNAINLQQSIDLLEFSKQKIEKEEKMAILSGDKARQEIVQNQLLTIGLEIDQKRLAAAQQKYDLRKAEIDLENKARGTNLEGLGFANSFGGMADVNSFLAASRVEFANIGTEMGEKIGNSIKVSVGIAVGAIADINNTIVDALLTRTWDGKEEGRSFAEAMKESLKATLRQSIGQAIKDNMTQAIVTMLGQQDATIVALQADIIALNLNTTAVQANTAAQAVGLNTMASGSGDLFSAVFGAAGFGGLITPAASAPGAGTPFARGGVVDAPTQALIGESGVEAVVPLPENRAIPVQLSGDTESNVNINQSFDFRGADGTTEARLRQFAGQIKKETTKEIFDSINRGGSTAKTVGRR